MQISRGWDFDMKRFSECFTIHHQLSVTRFKRTTSRVRNFYSKNSEKKHITFLRLCQRIFMISRILPARGNHLTVRFGGISSHCTALTTSQTCVLFSKIRPSTVFREPQKHVKSGSLKFSAIYKISAKEFEH